MAAKGLGPQVLALPQAGGAIRGLGEQFTPDLHSGSGKLTVPLQLPAGRNGVSPPLNLIYSTGFGNGPFGVGWQIGLSHISRSIRHGVPRYDEDDEFTLDGTQPLVAMEQSDGATRFRLQPQTDFLRIRKVSGNTWDVRGLDGATHLYGTARPVHAPDDWRDPAAVAHPDDASRIFCWRITSTVDPFGNRVEYEYERDEARSIGSRRWDQVYPKEIRYIDFGDRQSPSFLVKVRFEWEERPDPFSEYRAGFEVRTLRRCSRITIFSCPDDETLLRSYEFRYADQVDGESERVPPNGCSLLREIGKVGHDGPDVERLPPLRLDYTRFDPRTSRLFPVAFDEALPAPLGSSSLELVDLFGRGLPDIVEIDAAVRYWKNAGNGRYELPRLMDSAPADLRLADPAVQLIDADGNGLVDLVVNSPTASGYFPLRAGGRWDATAFKAYTHAPPFALEDPEVLLLDLDGDGVVDALRTGTNLECYFNDPQQGWRDVRVVPRRAQDDFPDVSFSDSRVRLADMTGDGLLDIVFIQGRNVCYWPNHGRGDFGPAIEMGGAPALPIDFPPERVSFGDVDGDGLADLVFVDDGEVTIWMNKSGNAWSSPIHVRGTPTITTFDSTRLVDLEGHGVLGILWSSVLGGDPARHFFLDLAAGTKPYLLNEYDNRLGAVTQIEYASSTRDFIEDDRDPRTRWRTALPFPVQVVARVNTTDQISRTRLTTEYHYHHGLWDGERREFCGFGRVDYRDTFLVYDFNDPAAATVDAVPRGEFSPPTETRTWFHQGVVMDALGDWYEPDLTDEYWPGDARWIEVDELGRRTLAGLDPIERRDALRELRGRTLRSEVYELDGSPRADRPYTVVECGYGVRIEETSQQNGTRIFFPHLVAERTTRWDRGDEPMTHVRVVGGYDGHAQTTFEMQLAAARGRDPRHSAPAGTPYLASLGTTRFATRDDDTLLADRIAVQTHYEIINDGSLALLDLVDAIASGLAARRVIGQTLNFYDGPAFVGLPLGDLGAFGALTRSEELTLTEDIARAAYGAISQAGTGAHYLGVDGASPGSEYPQEFLDRIGALAGHLFHDGSDADGAARGWFVQIVRNRCDFHEAPGGRGLLLTRRDPRDADLTLEYDGTASLIARVVDGIGLETRATHNYRVLMPAEIVDPNGNRTAYRYSPLGLLVGISVLGKPGETGTDTVEEPSVRFEHDAFAFAERGEPTSVRTVRRVFHAGRSDLDAATLATTLESVQFSDGFQRQVQTRTRAEAVVFDGDALGLPIDFEQSVTDATGLSSSSIEGPRVIVNGWRRYDNKGRVIAEFEPFFSSGFAFTPAADAVRGHPVQARFDALGRLVRSINPDGSEQRVVHGVPMALDNPDDFRPTPWESYTYDANDNAGRTHGAAANAFHHHWDTPGSVVRDGFDRIIASVSRTREPLDDGTWSEIHEQTTHFGYDIRGNRVAVVDAFGRVMLTQLYDLRVKHQRDDPGPRVLASQHIDAGARLSVFDAQGNEIERRDSKGALVLRAYDALNRPARMWCRDAIGANVTLRMRFTYGDSAESGLTTADAAAGNWLGRTLIVHDESGRTTIGPYDFKGNPLERRRRAFDDAFLLQAFDAPPPDFAIEIARTDWEPPPGTTLSDLETERLEADELVISWQYDALNRVERKRYPRDASGERKQLELDYGDAMLLDRVSLAGTPVIERLAYDARGRSSVIALGNGLLTRMAYDPVTHRPARLRTERVSRIGDLTYHPVGDVLQNIAYAYDLAGNVRRISDRVTGRGIPGSVLGGNELQREFEYDPLYQLASATGREADETYSTLAWEEWALASNPAATRAYLERYRYDAVGNLTSLQHTSIAGGYTRESGFSAGSNRLDAITVSGTTFDYRYDVNGNLLREHTARHHEWDHQDRLKGSRTQAGTSEPSLFTIYLYDGEGVRVKKLTRKQGGDVESTLYVDGDFERRRTRSGGVVETRDTLHLLLGERPAASMTIRSTAAPIVIYHLIDHLGSVEVLADEAGMLLHREEYTPFGESVFGASPGNRFRWGSKERDVETGMCFHGARYYLPWIARWASVDPLYSIAPDSTANDMRRLDVRELVNGYAYARNNPIRHFDRTGLSTAGGVYNFFLLLIRVASNVLSIAATAAMVSGTMTARKEGFRAGVSAGKEKFVDTFKWQMTTPAGVAVSIGAGILGLIHGIRMWQAGTHDSAGGFFAFLVDNTWALPNSLVGSAFAAITVGKTIDKNKSEGSGRLIFTTGYSPNYDTTFGNVTVGTLVPDHEGQHVLQARIFGFYFYPIYIFNYAINLIPYWLLFQSSVYPTSPINTPWQYFSRGVYACTVFEMWAYADQGTPP